MDDFMQQFAAGFQMARSKQQDARREQLLQLEQQQQQERLRREQEDHALNIETRKLDLQKAKLDQKLAARQAMEQFGAQQGMQQAQASIAPGGQHTLPGAAPIPGMQESAGPPAEGTPTAPAMVNLPGIEEYGVPAQQRSGLDLFRDLINKQKRARETAEADSYAKARGTEKAEAEFRAPVKPDKTLAEIQAESRARALGTNSVKPPADPNSMSDDTRRSYTAVTTKFQADPQIKAASDAQAAIALADQAIANPGSAPNQLMVVYSLIKNLDQGSAVREGETALVQSTMSYVSRFENAFAKLSQNQLLPPETTKEFAEATKQLAKRWVEIGDRKTQQYRAQANGLGIGKNFDSYLSESGISTPSGSSGGPKKPSVVINGVTVEEM